MFTVFFTNFGYGPKCEFDTLDAALEYAKDVCFESTILRGREVIASWSPISGTRHYGTGH